MAIVRLMGGLKFSVKALAHPSLSLISKTPFKFHFLIKSRVSFAVGDTDHFEIYGFLCWV